MVIELLKHWEFAVDGLQIFLCLLILFFLIRNRRPKTNTDLKDFNSQVFSKTLTQQIEVAFANILEVAASERRNLDKLLKFHQFSQIEPNSAKIEHQPSPSKDNENLQRVSDMANQDDRQGRIQRLASRGLSAKQISKDLKAPLNEVELVLSLHDRSQE